MKLSLYFFILFSAFILVSCSEKNDEPRTPEEKLIGYWAITHIKTIEHKGETHQTIDEDVPPHGVDPYAGEEEYRYDVLIFDEDFVTVRGRLPNIPLSKDYDMNSLEGYLQYITDFDNWNENIGHYTDQHGFPVGTYSIKDNHLIIGLLDAGQIHFNSDNEFTLDYSKTLNTAIDYRRIIYTFTRIYSLTL